MVVIIGGGLAGMSTAYHLGARDHGICFKTKIYIIKNGFKTTCTRDIDFFPLVTYGNHIGIT